MDDREPKEARLRELLWESERLATRVRALVEVLDRRPRALPRIVWPRAFALAHFFE
jgi:hypothetical protein